MKSASNPISELLTWRLPLISCPFLIRPLSGFSALCIALSSLWLATPADATVTFTAVTKIITTANVSASSTTPVDVTGLTTTIPTAGYTGDALVVGTFSSRKDTESKNLVATYSLSSNDVTTGGMIGSAHKRDLTKGVGLDTGAGSVLGKTTITNAGATLSLQHSADSASNPDLETIVGSTLTAIPLKSDVSSKTLESTFVAGTAPGNSGTEVVVGSTVGTGNQLNVAAIHSSTDEIFVMASFDVKADVSVEATWNLQYKEQSLADVAANWTNIGNEAQRTVGTSEGIVTMVGLANLGESGGSAAYDIRLIQNSNGTALLETISANIVALSLAIDADQYLQSYKADTVSATGASISLSLDANMQVFAASNVTATTPGSGSYTGTYSLIDGATTPNVLSSSNREVAADSGIGSAGLAAVYNGTTGTNTLSIGTSDTTNVQFGASTNFVAFALTSSFSSVPEPSSISLILLAGTLAICRRSRKAAL